MCLWLDLRSSDSGGVGLSSRGEMLRGWPNSGTLHGVLELHPGVPLQAPTARPSRVGQPWSEPSDPPLFRLQTILVSDN